MAAYPSYGYKLELTPDDGRQLIRSVSGEPRIKDYFDDVWYTANVVHPCLSTSDKDTLIAWYATNKDFWNTFTESVSSIDYTMLISNEPTTRHLAGDWWEVTTSWVGKVTP